MVRPAWLKAQGCSWSVVWRLDPPGLCSSDIEDSNTSQNRVFGGLDIMPTEHAVLIVGIQ